jgi:hypothetical protein
MGGSTPHSLSEYYKGGGLVGNHSNNPNVPTSGTISFSNFYGANNTAPGLSSHTHTMVSGNSGNNITGPVGFNIQSGSVTTGSFSNNPQPSILNTGLRMHIQRCYWDLLCGKASFQFTYLALQGPTDGTGWSSINNGYDGNQGRGNFSISGGGSSSSVITCVATYTASTTNLPSANGGQTFTVVISA